MTAQIVHGAAVTGEDAGPCPWCGSKVKTDPENCIVYHALPTCDRFDKLDALSFISAMRRELERLAMRDSKGQA